MRYKIFLLITLFNFTKSFSQTLIKGIVTTKKDSDLIYNIEVCKKDSIVTTSKLNQKLNFFFNYPNLTKGDYLRITSLGYITLFIPLIESNNKIIDIGKIELAESHSLLNSVTVFSQKKMITTTNGNIKINVSNSSLANAGFGIDVIKKLPSVLVNDKKIEIIGRGTPLILIDERKSTQKDLELLASDQIATIEIIKNTGVEYSASANTILKITTISQKYNGWNLKITSQLSKATYYKYYGAIDLGYKKDKATYLLYFNLYPNKVKNKERHLRNFPFNQYVVENNIVKDINNPINFDGGFTTTQELNKTTSIHFQTINSFNKIQELSTNYIFITNNNATETIYTEVKTPTKSINHSDNFSITKKIDSLGKTINLMIDYAYYKEKNEQAIFEKRNNNQMFSSATFYNNAQTFSLNPQLTIPFKKYNLNIKTGFRYSFFQSINSYTYFSLIENKIQENIFASYLQIDKGYKKFNFTTGFRYEYAKSIGRKDNSVPLFSRVLNNLFPSLSMQYSFNKDLKTNLSYSYKINRPNLNDITSYTVFVDSLTSFSGNPNLIPEFNHIIDYSLIFKELASLSISYINAKNPIFYFIKNYQGIKANVLQDNFSVAHKITISLNIPYQYKFWTTYNSIVYISQNNIYKEKYINLSNKMLYLFLYNSFKVNNLLNFDFTYQYNTTGLLGLFEYKPQNILSLTINKKLKGNKIEFYAQANDILNQDKDNATTTIQDLKISTLKFHDQQSIRFGIIFKLNQLNNLTTKKLTSDDINRIKK